MRIRKLSTTGYEGARRFPKWEEKFEMYDGHKYRNCLRPARSLVESDFWYPRFEPSRSGEDLGRTYDSSRLTPDYGRSL